MQSREGKWVRDREFYSDQSVHIGDSGYFERTVTYGYVASHIVFVKSLQIRHYDGNTLAYLYLTPSPFYTTELFNIVKKIFPNARKHRKTSEVKIKLTPDFTHLFLQWLDSHPLIKSQFTADILNELHNILFFIHVGEGDKKHNIALKDEAYPTQYLTMPPNTLSGLIALYMGMKYDDSVLYHCIQKILAAGENLKHSPQALNYFSLLAWRKDSTDVARLLLMYGANVLEPELITYLTPLELAFHFENPALADLILAQLSVPAPSISTGHHFVSANYHSDKQKIISSFRFTVGELYTTLKPAAHLTQEEVAGLYRLYSQCFEGEPSQATFAAQDNKYIDIIRHPNGKIVGGVIYHLRWDKDKLWVNNDLELFDSAYPNYGIMPVLTYRFPFALQLLYPHLAIWIVGFSAHFNTFRRFQGQLVVPMFRPAGKVEEIANVLKDKFNYKFTLTNDDATVCYIKEKEPAIVKGASQSNVPGLMEELYQRLRGNRGDGNVSEEEIKTRNVLVGILVTYEFLILLQRIAASKGINFYSVVFNTARQLFPSQLIPDAPRDLTPRYFNAATLFWQNRRITAEKFNHHQLLTLPKEGDDAKPRL